MSAVGAAPQQSVLGETERIIGWLRLPALVVLLLARTLPHPDAEPEWFHVTLAGFAVWTVVALGLTATRVVGRSFALVATSLDIGFFTALTALSGGPFSNVRFAYAIVPVVVAFRMWPGLSAAAGVATVLAFVGQAVAHPAFGDENAGRVVLVYGCFLVWLCLGCLLLSKLLARRREQVVALLESRTTLLAEVLDAEERERRRLAEALHDGAVQSLLSAKQDMEELQSYAPAANALGAVNATLRDLRAAVYELHPYVLDEVGLAAAITRLAETTADRIGAELELDVTAVDRCGQDGVMYSLARELLANVARHSGASRLRVSLHATAATLQLRVGDDGRGIDPARLAERTSEGHIGLASQRARVEAAGGTLEISTELGVGTTVEARLPLTG